MEKEVSVAFKKTIYLLGKDKDGIKYWLEAPSWDCKWYWGFGYIETYTNNIEPSKSNGIKSHQHWDGTLQKGNINVIGFTTEDKREYIHNPYDCNFLEQKTFSEEEGWELGELFTQFYFLQEAAEMFGRGKAHVSNTKISLWKDEDKVKEINEVLIPMVTKRILEILTPKKQL